MEIYEPGIEIGQYRILSAPMMGDGRGLCLPRPDQ